jgi:ATP-dependent RNA helicase DOB1
MCFLELSDLEIEKAGMEIADEATVKDYYELRRQLDTYTRDMRDVITHPNYCLQFMQAGRLVRIKYKDYDFGWGAVVNFTPRKANKGEELTPQQSYVIDVLLQVANDTNFAPQASHDLPPGVRPPAAGEKGKMEVIPVLLSCIDSIGHLRLFLPSELKSVEQRNGVRKALEEVKKRFPDGIAILDPIENMGITDDSFKKLLRVSSTGRVRLS